MVGHKLRCDGKRRRTTLSGAIQQTWSFVSIAATLQTIQPTQLNVLRDVQQTTFRGILQQILLPKSGEKVSWENICGRNLQL